MATPYTKKIPLGIFTCRSSAMACPTFPVTTMIAETLAALNVVMTVKG
jgi:hypothetical protein